MAKPNEFNDELFKEAVAKYQIGDWKASKTVLDKLHETYPQNKDVVSLLDEVRTHLDRDEREKKLGKLSTRQRNTQLIPIIGLALVLLLLIGYVGITTINNAAAQAREVAATQKAASESEYFYNARSLLDEDRPSDALRYVESLKASDPNYPGLRSLMSEAEAQQQLEILYGLAETELELENYPGALLYLRNIYEADPSFRDVNELVSRSERLAVYGDIGIAGQYLVDAESLLAEGLGPDEDLGLIQANLDSASRLGPNSETFRNRLELLQNFLDALSAFASGNPIESIPRLEFFIANSDGLFNAMANLMLQEAYLAQGDAGIQQGHSSEALGSLLLAKELADNNVAPPLYSLLTIIKLASTIGELGLYQDATILYAETNETYNLEDYFSSGTKARRDLDDAAEAYTQQDFRTAFIKFDGALGGLFPLLTTREMPFTTEDSLLKVAISQGCPIELLAEFNKLNKSEMYPEINTIIIPTFTK